MADIVAALVPWLLAGALTYLLHSTLFIGGVWIWLCLFARTEHAVREQLWKWAIVAGFVTTPIQLTARTFDVLPVPSGLDLSVWSPFSKDDLLLGNLQHPSRDSEDAQPPQRTFTHRPTSLFQALPPPRHRLIIRHRSREGESSSPSISGALTSGMKSGHWGGLFLMIVVVLAIFLPVVYLAWQQLSLVRFESRANPVNSGEMWQELVELCKSAGVRSDVTLLSGPDQTEPAAYGILRWRILIPERALVPGILSPLEQRALLAHELAHLVRRDTCWLWLTQLACTCFAFQPLNRLARFEWRKSGEFLCDRWAVSHAVPPLELARCLTTIASWKFPASPIPCLSAVHGPPELSQRVELLLKEPIVPATHCRLPRACGLLIVWGILLGLTVRYIPGPSASAGQVGIGPRQEPSVPTAMHRTQTHFPSREFRPGQRHIQPHLFGHFGERSDEWERLDRELYEFQVELAELQDLVQQAPPQLRNELELRIEEIAVQTRQLEALRDTVRAKYEESASPKLPGH